MKFIFEKFPIKFVKKVDDGGLPEVHYGPPASGGGGGDALALFD